MRTRFLVANVVNVIVNSDKYRKSFSILLSLKLCWQVPDSCAGVGVVGAVGRIFAFQVLCVTDFLVKFFLFSFFLLIYIRRSTISFLVDVLSVPCSSCYDSWFSLLLECLENSWNLSLISEHHEKCWVLYSCFRVSLDAHRTLVGMGYSENAATEGLRQANNDINQAIQV